MRNRRQVAFVVGILVVIGVAIWWWRTHQKSDTPATATVTQPAGSGQRTPKPKPATLVPATVSVSVTDAKGALANATVRLAPEDGDVIVVKTNTDGIASTKLAPGKYDISASALEHQPSALPSKTIAAGEDIKLALVLAAGGRTLAGHVTDVSGGPIAGARIDAAKLGGMARPDRAVATTVTGADGRYSMTVAEGQLLVAARSADYAPQSRYVDVGPSGATADFSLVPGGVIEGVVLDDKTKEPISGASVDARRDTAMIMMAEAGGHHTTAGPDGKFRLAGLPPGAYELGASLERLRTKSPTVVGLGVAEQVSDVRLLVGASPVVRGKVVDEAGAAVAAATVRAIGEGPDGAEAKSDAGGAFTLEGLNAGRFMVFATSELFVPAGTTPIELADKDLDGVTVTVRRGIKLKGHVEPRQIADVSFESGDNHVAMPTMLAPVTTTDNGEFELGPIAPGKGTLSARCPSGDQGSMTVEISATTGDLVLKVTPGASIAGRVVDGDNKPVAGASVMAATAGPSERTTIVNGMITSGVQGITNGNGAYELKGLSPGTYRMTALDRGRPLRMRGKTVEVKLAAAEKKTSVDLAVDRPNGVIKGVVTGPDGKPLADAWVSVTQDLGSLLEGAMRGAPPGPGGDSPGESRMVTVESRDEGGGAAASAFPPALTDADGKFQITGLPHTSFEVIAEAQAGKLRGRATSITPDATLAIQALGVTSLSGTVKSPKGPAALFTVELDGPTREQRSFTDGTFSLGRVDAGNYTVKVTSGDGNAETKVVVAPNTPATVDIVLVANAVVIGTLVDAGGKPVAGVPLTVVDDHGDGRMQVSMEGPPPTSGPDGKFRVEHKAGLGTLVVMTPPRPITKRGLALEAGKTLDVGQIRVAAEPSPKP